MTLLQDKPPLADMPGQHKRPLLAFVVVAIVCGVVVASALRSDAVVSLLRTAADNVVAGTSLLHQPPDEPSLMGTTWSDERQPDVVPGFAFGHDKGKARGEARGHDRPGARGLPTRRHGGSSGDRVTGHARSHLGGHATGHTKGKAQGQAKGHHKTHGGKQKGHARAHTRGANRR